MIVDLPRLFPAAKIDHRRRTLEGARRVGLVTLEGAQALSRALNLWNLKGPEWILLLDCRSQTAAPQGVSLPAKPAC